MDPSKILSRALYDALKVTLTVMLTAVLLFVIAASCFAQTPIYTTTYVAPDGAVGTNAAWEAGQSKYWYPELQKVGADDIEQGIAQENPALINEGLLIDDWGFAHMGADGSFPGCGSNPIARTSATTSNATQTVGGVFHSTSLFFEAASRSVLDLRAYSPVTYPYDPNTYTAKLASYSANLELIAGWLTNAAWVPCANAPPVSVPLLGNAFDMPYSHRFYLLAAGLQECADVTGDTNLVTGPYGANWWIDQAFPRQLGPGWQAAILTSSFAGNAPATLLAPNAPAPAGTASVISALGVNPERSGYDVSYHMVGCLHATRWYNASSDAARKAQVVAMLIPALQWERSRQATSGMIDSTGSTRVGVDITQDGTGIKTLATGEVAEAFAAGGAIDHKGRDTLAGIRFVDQNTPPSVNPVSALGAVGTNCAYDANPAAGYSIKLQKDGADWIAAGVYHENDNQIATGLSILLWGMKRQAADGSFSATSSPYTDTAFFVEAVARGLILLENYHPISHPLNQDLLASVPQLTAALQASANYLLTTTGYTSKASASYIETYFAAFAESAILCPASSASFTAQAGTFLNQALSLQLADGTNPESGAFSGNAQALGILMAERAFQYGALTVDQKASVIPFVRAALLKEESVVNVDGSMTYSSPATVTIQTAFQAGQAVTGDARDDVIYQRIAN